jgi:hypothetical protein
VAFTARLPRERSVISVASSATGTSSGARTTGTRVRDYSRHPRDRKYLRTAQQRGFNSTPFHIEYSRLNGEGQPGALQQGGARVEPRARTALNGHTSSISARWTRHSCRLLGRQHTARQWRTRRPLTAPPNQRRSRRRLATRKASCSLSTDCRRGHVHVRSTAEARYERSGIGAITAVGRPELAAGPARSPVRPAPPGVPHRLLASERRTQPARLRERQRLEQAASPTPCEPE